MQGTPGAVFHDALRIPHAGLILRKGIHRSIDSYSTFYENDRTTPTGLTGYLRDRGITRVFLAGLPLDFCVRYLAEDGVARLPRDRRPGLAGCDSVKLCRPWAWPYHRRGTRCLLIPRRAGTAAKPIRN